MVKQVAQRVCSMTLGRSNLNRRVLSVGLGLSTNTKPSPRHALIDCSKVRVRPDAYGGAGTFAGADFKEGDLIERGVVRRLPLDGNHCRFVLSWSNDRSTWAAGSGAATFYNCSLAGIPNVQMVRSIDEDRFEVYALRNIAKGEELTRQYESLDWRDCYADLRALRANGAGQSADSKATREEDLMDCSKLYAKRDEYGGVGAYAAVPIKKGELVERGIVRRVPVDGNISPYVFTWSTDRSVWGTGSGLSVFYNASLDGGENTEMLRVLDEDRFEMYAMRDLAEDEELTHLYKSMEWRDCFKELRAHRDATLRKSSGAAGTKRGFATATDAAARSQFKEYWGNDHSAPSLENMMLDSDASEMDRLERPEILSQLPSLTGKRVLELGAGIGRFSGVLASKAGEVVAADFVETSCEANRQANAHHKNLTVMNADVTVAQFEPQSFDVVFSNWLLMYLTDDEVKKFANKALSWLKPGGSLFFRESCFHASGNAARRFNPTQYRDPQEYAQMFSDATAPDGSCFQLMGTNFVDAYAKTKGNFHQTWFRWEKLGPNQSERRTRLLSIGQYTTHACFRYEAIYGYGYIYTGGDKVSQRLLEACGDSLSIGARVLDIGCGLGGTAMHFAKTRSDIYVHGVTFVPNLYSIVMGRHAKVPSEIRDRVAFELAPESGIPESELRYPPNSFDVVIVRETLMYLEGQDKPVLLQKIHRLLRPGGRLVVVDYCAGKPKSELSTSFKEYLNKWGYFLLEASEQQALLKRYFEVESINSTDQFMEFMDEGLQTIDAQFGPNALARQGSNIGVVQLQSLHERLVGSLKTDLPNMSEAILQEAAAAAVNVVSNTKKEEDSCRTDHEWATNIWSLERKAVIEGELNWNYFVATKK